MHDNRQTPCNGPLCRNEAIAIGLRQYGRGEISVKIFERPFQNLRCEPYFTICAAVIIAVILYPLIGTAGAEPEKDEMTIVTRVMAGGGFTKSSYDFSGMKNSNSHQSVQILAYVSDTKAAGIEFGKHSVFTSDQANYEYQTIGIVLEAMLFGFWVNQIGTIGYFGEGDNKSNPVGLRSSAQ